MQQEVYADLYFLINTSMNLICLMITAALMHRSVRRLRAVLAASVGGIYAVLSLLFFTGGVPALLCDVAIAILMCAVTFWQKDLSIGRLIKASTLHVLVSMLLGGIMTALYSLMNRLALPLDSLQGDGLSVWAFALLTSVASLLTLRGGHIFKRSAQTKSVCIEATLFGKKIVLRAMVDTGNLLRDPTSGRSVIVVERTRLSPLLPPCVATALEKKDYTACLTDYKQAKSIRLIPTQTVTGETILAAFIPERLYITEGKHTYEADYLIAPADLQNSAQGFDAVIPPI